MTNIALKFDNEEVQMIVSALGEGRFREVNQLITKIVNASNKQIEADRIEAEKKAKSEARKNAASKKRAMARAHKKQSGQNS